MKRTLCTEQTWLHKNNKNHTTLKIVTQGVEISSCIYGDIWLE